MTNASIRNLLFGLTVVAIAAALSLGAFATIAHADGEDWSYDMGSDWSYDMGSDWSYDMGSDWSYDMGNDWSYDMGNDWSYDMGSDWSYPLDDCYTCDWSYDMGNDWSYPLDDCYSCGQYESYSFKPFSSPMSIVPPKFSTPSFPSYPQYPSYPPQQPPKPQPPVYQPPVYIPPAPQPPVTNNNCVNNSCNVNTNTNVNTNVTTISQATPQPIVQYVAPQYPVYPSYPVYPQTQAPYCVITIGQGYYTTGMITLTWSSQGHVTSAYITPSVGQVAPNGSTSLYAYGNTVYSLTVSGPGGTYTCHTQSYVAPAAPVSPYVSLTQIPYTGISMGPIANIAYWTGLIALAIAGAYLMVYYKGGALALATSMISRSRSEEVTEEIATPATEVSTFALPTTNESMTRDAMKVTRDAYGTPRLVISRA